MSQIVEVAKVSEIPLGTGKEVTVKGRVVAVFHVEGEFFALDGLCLHAGGPVGGGHLQGCIVTCPWHGWQYDVRNGQHQLNNRLRLDSYPTHVQGEAVMVELPD